MGTYISRSDFEMPFFIENTGGVLSGNR